MNNFVGKICPFCKTELKEGDEIVICSNCDMPHHKECWIENQGCTTFGCMGTIKSADNEASSVTATELSYEEPAAPTRIFCTKCGIQNEATSSFCIKCGNPLHAAPGGQGQANPPVQNTYAYQQQANPMQGGYQQPNQGTGYSQQNNPGQGGYNPSYQQNQYHNPNSGYGQPNYNYNPQNNVQIDGDVVSMIGQKQEYYVSKFQYMKFQNKKTTWNWVAFFFAPYWCMYRKMYGYGFIGFGVSLLASLLENALFSLLALGGYITFGLFANYLYMQWLETKAGQAKFMNEPYKTQLMQKNGGVNQVAMILSIVGWVIVSAIISAL